MKCVALMAVIGALVGVPPASAAELITNVAGRQTTSLDGPWQTIVDPYENGYYDYRREPMANGFFRNEKPKDKSDRIEYDFDTCRHPEGARRLEHAARVALLLRGHDLVREVLRLRAARRQRASSSTSARSTTTRSST